MPKLLTTPFAASAAPEYRTDIQNATGEAPNSATYQEGFPPITFQPLSSSGIPPKGADFNGVLYDITDNIVFLTQGGVYPYNAAYATSIGGYPLNARVSLNNGNIVQSRIANNTNDPNVNMSGWVLDNWCFESFGVEADGTDQSSKIQAAIDFFLANNIRRFGFRDSKKYCIGSPIRFKQVAVSDSANYADPKNTIICDFNGAYLDALTPNQIAIVVSRDVVQLNDPIITSSVSGVIGIYNGLDIENNDLSLRRSSMRMVLNNPKFENLDIAMKFEPAETKSGAQWGAFYHCVTNPHAVNTKIMYDFRQSKGAGDCSNTRNVFIGTKHVGGACTIYGEALESSLFLGIESEFITQADSRLPNGEAVALYLPYGTPSDFQANKGNTFTSFNIEVCTNYINIDAPNTDIDGFMQGATNPKAQAWIYNNNYGNVHQKDGGVRLVAYNKTPRFGMLQIDDNGESNSLYLEVDDVTSNYRLVADNRIALGNMSFSGSAKSETNRLHFFKNDDAYSFYVDFSSIYSPCLGSTTGELSINSQFLPLSDNALNIGSAGNRFAKIFSGKLNLSELPVFSDNTAAIAGGLLNGDLYKTLTGALMVVY